MNGIVNSTVGRSDGVNNFISYNNVIYLFFSNKNKIKRLQPKEPKESQRGRERNNQYKKNNIISICAKTTKNQKQNKKTIWQRELEQNVFIVIFNLISNRKF